MAAPQKKETMKIKIRKGDLVRVISGKGAKTNPPASGRVLDVDREKGRLIVEGVRMITKHVKPNPQRQIKGGISKTEGWIHVSNVMVLTSDGKPSRIGSKTDGETKVRVARKTGEVLAAKK